MHYLVSASTRGGARRFVVPAETPAGALAALTARIQRQRRVTDEFGGLYAGSELDPGTVALRSGPLPYGDLASLYRYTVDGRQIA